MAPGRVQGSADPPSQDYSRDDLDRPNLNVTEPEIEQGLSAEPGGDGDDAMDAPSELSDDGLDIDVDTVEPAIVPPRFPSRGLELWSPAVEMLRESRLLRELPRPAFDELSHSSHSIEDSIEGAILRGVLASRERRERLARQEEEQSNLSALAVGFGRPDLSAFADPSLFDSDILMSSVGNRLGDGSLSDKAAVAPVPVNEDSLPDDLICSICMTLPVDPVLTPSNYMFCRSCIHTSLERKEECPVTRSHCCAGSLRSPEGFVRRLWSSVQVKCGRHGNGCAWTGSVADYPAHSAKCTATSIHYPAHKKMCTETPDQVRIKNLTSELMRAKEAHRKALEEIGRLERENAELVSSFQKAIHNRSDTKV